MMHKFSRAKVIVAVMVIMFTITALYFATSYIYARSVALRYLEIITIYNEQSYQDIKAKIEMISPEYTRKSLFKRDHYTGPTLKPISYKVNSVRGFIKGIGHFTFLINFTVYDWKTVTIVVYVSDGKVYMTHGL